VNAKVVLVCVLMLVVGLVLGAWLVSRSPGDVSFSRSNMSSQSGQVHWRLAQSWPRNFPIFSDAVRKMVSIVDVLSDGQFKISIEGKNKHKAPLAIFDMVKSGLYEMGHSASYYWKGKVPNTLFFTTLPFGMTSMEQYAWFYHGGGFELMDEVYAPHNLLSFLGGNTGNQMAGWFQKEIRSVEDFKGLKIRIPGFAGEVMMRVGASPENIPAGDLYTALDRNTIDAVEWMGPSLDVIMGFHKIADFYYTGWHEPSSELQYLVNKEAFEALPLKFQSILQVAMKVAAFELYVDAIHQNSVKLAEIKADFPTVVIKTFPPEEYSQDLPQPASSPPQQTQESESSTP